MTETHAPLEGGAAGTVHSTPQPFMQLPVLVVVVPPVPLIVAPVVLGPDGPLADEG